MVHPSIMVQKKLLPTQKYFYKNRYGINADYYNLFEFLNYGKFANLPEYLLSYRIHGDNGSLKKLKRCYWDILLIRLEATFHLHYKLSVKNFIAMIIQTGIVSFLPERTLQYLYFSVKGYHMDSPLQTKFSFSSENIFQLTQNLIISPVQQRAKSFSNELSNWSHGVLFSSFRNE